jgi:N-hydroxyarylamine O-acetyltransferase
MNIAAYLARIGLDDAPAPNLAGLTTLHRAHLRAIPYENLDVQFGHPVTIEIPAIYDKLVTRRRGGWCYEMNGLFGWALGELGFDVTRTTGAVGRSERGPGSDGNHLVLKVELEEGTYIADVGFGDGPVDPFRIAVGAFTVNGFPFSVSRIDGEWWRLHNHPAGGAPNYDFHLSPAKEAQLAAQCQWLQTSEASPFVQHAIVMRHVEDGIIVLRGRVLRGMTPDRVTDMIIDDADTYVETLRETFGLDLPEAASLWPAICECHEALFDTGHEPAA